MSGNVTLQARLAAMREELARWHDQGRIYTKMRFHPWRKWFNGNGEALQWCAERVEKILFDDAALLVGVEPLPPTSEDQ